MEEKFVINIGRQLASGGRIIGEELAKSFHIPFYDKEIIKIASQESGLKREFFENADEKKRFNLLGSLHGWFSGPTEEGYLNNYLQSETLFKIQSDVILKLANQHSCVFVGRCADYILREHPRAINIFISANMDDRVERIMEYDKNINAEKAREKIENTDKQRANYYNFYTRKNWGMASSYDLCVNSSIIGIDRTVELIKSFVCEKLKR